MATIVGIPQVRRLLTAAAVALMACSTQPAQPPSVVVVTGDPNQQVTIFESGSTLMRPYLDILASDLAKDHPKISLKPTEGGSAKGVSDVIDGVVVLGGSDAYLSDGQAAQNPELLNIPIAISTQAIAYNVPTVPQLRLSGDIIARIYEGTITMWNDRAISRLNPGVALPADLPIKPIRRADGSGDTFIFTSLLNATNEDWRHGPGYGTSVDWPSVPAELVPSGGGNQSIADRCKVELGCIAYVGSSANMDGLSRALLQNRSGRFVRFDDYPTISKAIDAEVTYIAPDLRMSLIDLDGAGSYPIVNFEYLMVKSRQPDADTALAVRTFLAWAIDPKRRLGVRCPQPSANAACPHFLALPRSVAPRVQAAIASIQEQR